jgi:hypothetical protein
MEHVFEVFENKHFKVSKYSEKKTYMLTIKYYIALQSLNVK